MHTLVSARQQMLFLPGHLFGLNSFRRSRQLIPSGQTLCHGSAPAEKFWGAQHASWIQCVKEPFFEKD